MTRLAFPLALACALAPSAPARPEPPVPIPAMMEEPGVPAPASGEVPREFMRPIPLSAAREQLLDLYPRNDELVNPFGTGTPLTSHGLMQWLAPRGDGSRWHSGLDLVPRRGRAAGRKIYSPGDGYVVKVADGHPDWGSYLLVAYRQGDRLLLTGWFHLRWRSHRHLRARDMSRGRTGRISRGDLLGRVGSTGSARGAHLHLDVVELDEVVSPDRLPRTLWTGRDWSEFLHPADAIAELPRAIYHDRERPSRGVMMHTRLPLRDS